MGVTRRANRKFRYSRTELGNHYTGVEANNKRVSYNAYLLDFLKTSLRAEFTRLFYRFSYGFKAEDLQETTAFHFKNSAILTRKSVRANMMNSESSSKVLGQGVELGQGMVGVGWRVIFGFKKRLKFFLSDFNNVPGRGEGKQMATTLNFMSTERYKKRPLTAYKFAFRKLSGELVVFKKPLNYKKNSY